MAPKESPATKSPGKVPNLQRFAHWLPLAVLTVGLLLTYELWKHEHQIVARDLRANFDFLVQEDLTLIKQRMQAYEQVLRGTRGLFTASESVERHEFRDYVTALGLEESYRGIQGVGFTQIVPAARLQSHIESVRRKDSPITPSGRTGNRRSIPLSFTWSRSRAAICVPSVTTCFPSRCGMPPWYGRATPAQLPCPAR